MKSVSIFSFKAPCFSSSANARACSVDDVKKAVEEAQSLSDDELDGWSYFADQIDFDTDNPPEPVADDAGSDDGGAAQQSAPTGNAVTDAGAPSATGGGSS